MATWPGSLPQRPLLDGFSSTFQDGTLRPEVDSGPSLTRPRFSAVSEYISARMVLTTTQRTTLETFYHTTLVEGSDTITWVHPVDGSAITAKFMKPPAYRALSADRWEVVLSYEILP